MKELAEELSKPLMFLCNKTFLQGAFKKTKKKLSVVPLLKKSKLDDLSSYNYLDIDAGQNYGKVDTGTINNELKYDIRSHGNQHRFMENKSCPTNLILVFDEITCLVGKGNYVDIFETSLNHCLSST